MCLLGSLDSVLGGCDESESLKRSEGLGGEVSKNSRASFLNRRLSTPVKPDSCEFQSLFFYGLASGVNEFESLSLNVFW